MPKNHQKIGNLIVSQVQEKYPEIDSHICEVIKDEDDKPTSRIKDAAMIYEISDFEVVLNDKTGFLMTMKNIFNPFKSVMFFVDKKDGKIYDENGEQPKKITDIANCKFENSSLDQCSNIFSDPELYSMYQELVKNRRDNFLKYYIDGVETVEYTNDEGKKVSEEAISFNAEIFGDEIRKCYIDRYGDMFLLEQEGDVKKAYYCSIVNGYLKKCNEDKASIFSYDRRCLLETLRKNGFFLDSFDFDLRKNQDGSLVEEKLKTFDGRDITAYRVGVLFKNIDNERYTLSIDKNTGDIYATGNPTVAEAVEYRSNSPFRFLVDKKTTYYTPLADRIFRWNRHWPFSRILLDYLQKKCGLFNVDFVIKPDPEKTKKTLKYGDDDEHEINVDYEVEAHMDGCNQNVKLFVSKGKAYYEPGTNEKSPLCDLLESKCLHEFHGFNIGSIYNDESGVLLDKFGSQDLFKPKYYLKPGKKKIEVSDELIEVQELTVKMDDKEKTVFIETSEFPHHPGYCFYYKKDEDKPRFGVFYNYGFPKDCFSCGPGLFELPSLKKVLNANGIFDNKNKYDITTDLVTVKCGSSKISGYKIVKKYGCWEETFIVDEATARIFRFEREYSCDPLELKLTSYERIDAEARKKIFEKFKEKGLFSPKYTILNKDKNNGLVTKEVDGEEIEGYEVEIECNGKKTGTVFVQNDYTQRIYDQNCETWKKINPLTGVITDGPSWLSDLGLKDLRKTFKDNNIEIENPENNFLGVEKYESDSSLDKFILKYNHLYSGEEETCELRVDENGYMRVENHHFFSPGDFVNLAGQCVFDDKENTKFLPALRRVYPETEVQKKLIELFGPEVYKKSWYEEPNQRLKSIEFIEKNEKGDFKHDKFNLKVIIGPEDEGKQEEKTILVTLDPKDGYMRDENNNFIDLNGYELDGGVIAANLPEFREAFKNKGYIKNLPGYVDTDKKLKYLIEKVNGDENLIRATIIMPKTESNDEEKKGRFFYLTKDGDVYEDQEKNNKQKLVIDDVNKTACLCNLQPNEKFNLLENKTQEFNELLYEIQKFDAKFLNKKEQEKPPVPTKNYKNYNDLVEKTREAALYFSEFYGNKWEKELSSMSLDNLSKELKKIVGEDVLNAFSRNVNKFIEENNKNGELSVDGKKENPIDINKVKDLMAKKFNVSKYTKIIGGSLAGVGGASAAGLGALIAFGFVNPLTLIPAGAATLGGLGWILIEYSVKKYNKAREFNVDVDKNKKVVKFNKKEKPKQKVEGRINVFDKINSVVENKIKKAGNLR